MFGYGKWDEENYWYGLQGMHTATKKPVKYNKMQ